MLILVGKTGGGKTEVIKKLIEPLRPFIYEANVDEVNDSRNLLAFQDNFIALFDEMSRAEKADINCVKRMVTGEAQSMRRLGTNIHQSVPIRTTFIGASNNDLIDIIFDNTGMRRFWEMRTLDVLDWSTINQIDYIELYRLGLAGDWVP